MINAQLFSDLVDGPYTLTVHRTNQGDASQTFTVKRDSPGLFQLVSDARQPDGHRLPRGRNLAHARQPGHGLNETISIFGTGFGLYDRPMVDGFPTPDTGDWNVVDPITVTAGGQTYTPVTARAANGSTGMVVLQIKLTARCLPAWSI